MKTALFQLCILSMASLLGYAQESSTITNPIRLDNLSAFAPAAENWKIVGDLSGSYQDTRPVPASGAGILFNDFDEKIRNKNRANLFTRMEHGDIVLSVDFLMPRGSNSGIYLQGRYEVQLFDSWNVASPRASDCGGIYERWDGSRPDGARGYEGHPPLQNACLAPNLWQHLEIEFQAPRFDGAGRKIRPARFVRVVLNGVTIHQNVIVYGPTRAAAFADEKPQGPLMIQGDHGPVAFRNIRYALLNDIAIAASPVEYRYYEGKFANDFGKVDFANPARQGKSEGIDARLADDPNNFCLVFEGTINVPDTGRYTFSVSHAGTVQLEVDGEKLDVPTDWFKDVRVSRYLSKGEHRYTLRYIKNFSWRKPGVGMWVGRMNARPVPLHLPTSLPARPVEPELTVNPSGGAEIVRSFLAHNGKKKTHVISVGHPREMHYSYDLNQGGLLQVWKGDFLDVTDMWHERGEPQTAEPMGAAIVLPGRCALSPRTQGALPDTLDHERELVYKGHRVGADGVPSFQYQYRNASFTDQIIPDALGLLRTVAVGGAAGDDLVLRLADDPEIREVSRNVYVIGDQRYYVEVIPAGKTRPEVRSGSLIFPVKAGENKFQYRIIW